jgi:hypothetical protein
MKRMEGVTMSKFAIAGAALALLGGGVAFAGTSAVLDDGDNRGVTTSNRTTTTATSTTEERAERNRRGRGKGHKGRRGRHDRRHAHGVAERRRGIREPGEDVRGPCDEAENANDPRCTGAARDHDDRSGRGRGGRGRSGSNSGPG